MLRFSLTNDGFMSSVLGKKDVSQRESYGLVPFLPEVGYSSLDQSRIVVGCETSFKCVTLQQDRKLECVRRK